MEDIIKGTFTISAGAYVLKGITGLFTLCQDLLHCFPHRFVKTHIYCLPECGFNRFRMGKSAWLLVPENSRAYLYKIAHQYDDHCWAESKAGKEGMRGASLYLQREVNSKDV